MKILEDNPYLNKVAAVSLAPRFQELGRGVIPATLLEIRQEPAGWLCQSESGGAPILMPATPLPPAGAHLSVLSPSNTLRSNVRMCYERLLDPVMIHHLELLVRDERHGHLFVGRSRCGGTDGLGLSLVPANGWFCTRVDNPFMPEYKLLWEPAPFPEA